MSAIIEIDPHNIVEKFAYFETFEYIGGLVVKWALQCPNEVALHEYICNEYGYGREYPELPEGGYIENGNYRWRDPETGEEDEPLPPLVTFTRVNEQKQTEKIYIYQYSICVFVTDDKTVFIARFD